MLVFRKKLLKISNEGFFPQLTLILGFVLAPYCRVTPKQVIFIKPNCGPLYLEVGQCHGSCPSSADVVRSPYVFHLHTNCLCCKPEVQYVQKAILCVDGEQIINFPRIIDCKCKHCNYTVPYKGLSVYLKNSANLSIYILFIKSIELYI